MLAASVQLQVAGRDFAWEVALSRLVITRKQVGSKSKAQPRRAPARSNRASRGERSRTISTLVRYDVCSIRSVAWLPDVDGQDFRIHRGPADDTRVNQNLHVARIPAFRRERRDLLNTP